MHPNLQRAQLLFEQGRHSDAEREIRQALSHMPDDAEAHCLLTFILAEQRKRPQALDSAKRVINLAPDWSYAWYALAYAEWIQQRRGASDRALNAIGQAILLDPIRADYHYMRGEILFGKSEWEQALSCAEEALSLDSEHLAALNLRAKTLVKLNRNADANHTLDWAIHNDPENPTSHANKGWALIERDEYDEAITHFKEALRLDPNNAWAREGLKNAIKGKNILYRGILKYFLWMSKLNEKNQWLFIIGAYILYRIVLSISREVPALAPLTYPIIAAYIIFAFSSWIALPLSNLFLRLHPLGRHALNDFEVMGSNIMGGFIAGGLLCGFAYLGTGAEGLFWLAGWFLMMLLPLGGTLSYGVGETKNVRDLGIYTAVLGGVGLLGIAGKVFLANSGLFSLCIILFAAGIFLFGFVANYLMMRRY